MRFLGSAGIYRNSHDGLGHADAEYVLKEQFQRFLGEKKISDD